ncbi:MAG: NAD(P)H-binding protein [Deltaproteobacteria bacterium]|nr:NAD(P)H-binding protein [Deltaproteobacteria bacterium]
MTTAFVAGATGFTGREVVRALVEQGVRAFAHVRPDSPRFSEWQKRFSEMGALADSTAWTEDAMAETLGRLAPDVMFGLLGTTRARAKAERAATGKRVDYETIDHALTALLLKAALRSGHRPRFVYLSAAGTPDGDRPPLSAYGAARWKTEREVKTSGLPFVIARPSFIAGPGREDDRPAERFGVAVADGALRAAGVLGMRRLSERYRSTTNTALAQSLVRLALDPAAAGRVYESEALRRCS